MHKISATIIFMLVTFFSCQSTSPHRASKVQATSDQGTEGMIFVGCGPSVGECQLSCGGRDGRGLTGTGECLVDSETPVACYCPTGSGPVGPPVDLSKFYFAACVPNAGECKHSCSNKPIFFQPRDENCANEESQNSQNSQNGCYCSK